MKKPDREDRIAKLPKWAQQDIARLERDLAAARERLSAGPEDSDTFANPYGSAPTPLGQEPTIQFNLSEDGRDKIRVRKEGNRLDVNGSGGQLIVRPRASNSVELEMVGF